MTPCYQFLAVLIPVVFLSKLAVAESLASMGSPSASNEMCAQLNKNNKKETTNVVGKLKYDVKLGKVEQETIPVDFELKCNRDRETNRHTVTSCSLRSGRSAEPNRPIKFQVTLMVPDEKGVPQEEVHEFELKCGESFGAKIAAKTSFTGEPRSAYSSAFKKSNLFS